MRVEKRFNQMIRLGKADSDEAASLFYYLNRTCYNGLCRFQSEGRVHVPFGRYKKLIYKTDSQSTSPHSRTGNSRAWTSKRYRLEAGDFIYADPPYDVEFTQYSKEDFGWDDQVRLAELLRGIAAR